MKQLDAVTLTLPTNAKMAVIGGVGLGQGCAGPGAGAPGAADRRLDQDRRRGLFPAARIRAGRAHRLCRPGDLPVPAVGARQPAVRPEAPADRAGARTTTPSARVREAFWRESERAGNPAFDPNADWIDYELAGATGPADLLPCIVEALKQVEFDEDIYSLGLRGAIDAAERPDLAEKILKARHVLHGRLQEPAYAAPGRAVQCRPLQPEPVGGREPAVRHAGRQGLRRRQPRRRPLHADRS